MQPVKDKLVTWKDLGPRTKCIYQAFTKSETDKGADMAKYVNDQGVDADDGKAVLVLADRYHYLLRGAYTGQYFKSEVRFDGNLHLILVITTPGDVALMPGFTSYFASQSATQFNLGTSHPEYLLTSPKYQKVQWHAIYGKVSGSKSTFTIEWKDDQGQRSQGPLIGDLVIHLDKPR